jgi:hypothetical protein
MFTYAFVCAKDAYKPCTNAQRPACRQSSGSTLPWPPGNNDGMTMIVLMLVASFIQTSRLFL